MQYCRVTRATDQSIPNSAGTPVSFTAKESAVREQQGIWDGNTALYATETGVFHVEGCATWAINNTGTRYIYIIRNGTTIEAISNGGFATNNWYMASTVSCEIFMTHGEYVQLYVWQGSGAALNLAMGTVGWPASLSIQCVLSNYRHEWAGT